MRKTIAAGAALLGALALPAVAGAHVSIHPNVIPTGANATLNIRVPNEEDNASTTKIAVKFPDGFLDVPTAPPPGWTSKVTTTKLANPVKTDDGTVTTQVSEVVWTASKGTGIAPGHFQNFPIAVAMPGKAGDTLAFKTVQTYSNGKVVRWIGAESSDTPAPTVDVSAKGGDIRDVAGGEAGPGPLPAAGAGTSGGTTTPTATPTKVVEKKSSNGLAIAALIVALLALAAGLGAFLAARRSGHEVGVRA